MEKRLGKEAIDKFLSKRKINQRDISKFIKNYSGENKTKTNINKKISHKTTNKHLKTKRNKPFDFSQYKIPLIIVFFIGIAVVIALFFIYNPLKLENKTKELVTNPETNPNLDPNSNLETPSNTNTGSVDNLKPINSEDKEETQLNNTPGIVGTLENTCNPINCSEQNKQCGTTDDGCGKTINCGTCKSGDVCTDSGKCICMIKTCFDLGIQCGNADDGCGDSIDCGSCNTGLTCTNGKCVK